MRFGSFVLPVSSSHSQDSRVIDLALDQAVLAEQLGFDAVWLTEHHFSGDNAYADPVVFGAAVAMRTQTIRIGFAVLQMALHHPVRLAVQTALLDNLCHGRLTVGTGRGSAQNVWEYEGFGTTISEGAERLAEAETLLQKTWTEERFEFNGKYWKASVPSVQPRPYQQPHPPLIRACVSFDSCTAMGALGRPVMLSFGSFEDIGSRVQTFVRAMQEAGLTEAQMDAALDNSWLLRGAYVAESREQAIEEATMGFGADVAHLQETWDRLVGTERKFGALLQEHNLFAGTPDDVADRVAEVRKLGVRNLLLSMAPGGLSEEKVARSMSLFARTVASKFRES